MHTTDTTTTTATENLPLSIFQRMMDEIIKPCHGGCMQAYSDSCGCVCEGRNHGIQLRLYRKYYHRYYLETANGRI
jgi:hypothetical protein